MSNPALTIRLMTLTDLPAVLMIQADCYPPSMQEPDVVIQQRLYSAAKSCWVVIYQERLLAYLFSYPSQLGKITPLSGYFEITQPAEVLYIHDLAVSPQLRGKKAALALIQHAWDYAQQQGLQRSALVAVQDSGGFWQNLGYSRLVPTPKQQRLLTQYSEQAQYMVCDIY